MAKGGQELRNGRAVGGDSAQGMRAPNAENLLHSGWVEGRTLNQNSYWSWGTLRRRTYHGRALIGSQAHDLLVICLAAYITCRWVQKKFACICTHDHLGLWKYQKMPSPKNHTQIQAVAFNNCLLTTRFLEYEWQENLFPLGVLSGGNIGLQMPLKDILATPLKYNQANKLCYPVYPSEVLQNSKCLLL